MPTTAEVANKYHDLANKKIQVGTLAPFTQWLPKKVLGVRVHWNAIWHHRLAMEIACQISEGPGFHTFREPLTDYHREYSKLYSTMPFCSNKSISHYVGQCALDAVLNQKTEKNIITLDKAFNKVSSDGAFVEGGHYSKYVTDCFDRVESLFQKWYGDEMSANQSMVQSYKNIKINLYNVKRWQQLISDKSGIMAIIGDGWYERIDNPEPNGEGHHTYNDMSINRAGPWLTIQHHRLNGFALHQHPHGNEILIAHENDWLIRGSGMPSYKHVMKKPFKWRRPRNHFFTETRADWWWIWRLRKNMVGDTQAARSVTVNEEGLCITETGKKVVRFPGSRDDVIFNIKTTNSLTWSYGKFTFSVEGINIKLMNADYAYASTSYGNEEKIPVVRIRGENLKTRISVNDK